MKTAFEAKGDAGSHTGPKHLALDACPAVVRQAESPDRVKLLLKNVLNGPVPTVPTGSKVLRTTGTTGPGVFEDRARSPAISSETFSEKSKTTLARAPLMSSSPSFTSLY